MDGSWDRYNFPLTFSPHFDNFVSPRFAMAVSLAAGDAPGTTCGENNLGFAVLANGQAIVIGSGAHRDGQGE